MSMVRLIYWVVIAAAITSLVIGCNTDWGLK